MNEKTPQRRFDTDTGIFRELYGKEFKKTWKTVKDGFSNPGERYSLFDNYSPENLPELLEQAIIRDAAEVGITVSEEEAGLFITYFQNIFHQIINCYRTDGFFEACLTAKIIADQIDDSLNDQTFEITQKTSPVAGPAAIRLAKGWEYGFWMKHGIRGLNSILPPENYQKPIAGDGLNFGFDPTELLTNENYKRLVNLFTFPEERRELPGNEKLW